MRSVEESLSATCHACGSTIYAGYARCENPKCGSLRKEFEDYPDVVVVERGYCVLSGALSDVRLPNGDYLWAPYFLDFVSAEWLDADYRYSEKFYSDHPDLPRDS